MGAAGSGRRILIWVGVAAGIIDAAAIAMVVIGIRAGGSPGLALIAGAIALLVGSGLLLTSQLGYLLGAPPPAPPGEADRSGGPPPDDDW